MSKDVITRLKAVDEMSGPIGQISRNFGKFNQQCLSMQGIAGGVSKSLASMATSFMGPAAAVAALTGAIASNIQTARQFQQSIAGLQSLTGMSGDALEDLKKKAIELGGSTTQSASQVAESFMLIGSKMPELLKDADALQTVTKAAIRLAEASGGDVTTSANALTAALNIMGEGASEAERYINVMAATSQQGTRNIQELTDIVFRAGQNARATGISFEELMAIAGAGTKEFASAEQAGQALGKLFLQLEKQNNDKLKPSVVGVTEAIKNLTEANFDTVTATKMFTKNGAAAYMSIIHNKDAILQLLPNIQNTNTALDQANTNTNTLNGSLNKLSSAWEQFNLTLNDNNGFLKDGVDLLTEYVGGLNYAISALQDIKNGFTGASEEASTFGKYLKEFVAWEGRGGLLGYLTGAHDKAEQAKAAQASAPSKKQSYNYRLGIEGWKQKNAKPGLVDETPTFDDSTEEGIKAHIKHLKELRATADMAGQEYANLTAEITRLQGLLKTTTPKATKAPTIETGFSLDTIKGMSEYKKMYQDIVNTSERGSKKQLDAEAIVGDIDTFESLLEKAKKSGIEVGQDWMEAFYDTIIQGKSVGVDFFKPLQDQMANMTQGFSGPTTNAFSAWASDLQQQMGDLDVTSARYQNLRANLVDTTTLQNLVKTAMENGFNFQDLNIDVEGLWDKILNAKDIENADWQGIVDAINAKLAELNIPPIQLKFETGNLTQVAKESKTSADNLRGASQACQALGSALSSIEDPAAKVAGMIANAIASVAMGMAQMLAAPQSTSQSWGWIALAASATATMISTIAAIKSATAGSYAEGGWVGSGSGGFVGDAVPAFLNRGEYVMTANDVETANANMESAYAGGGQSARTTISGEQLVTVINNYGKRTGRGEILR